MMTLKTCARTCFFGSGSAWNSSPSVPADFRNGGGLLSVALGARRARISRNSATPGAGARGHEAHGHEVPFAQRLLERRVELLRGELLALLEVEVHQFLVDFHHLVDERRVRGLHRREIRIAIGIEEAIHDVLQPCAGRLIGRHSLPNTSWTAREESRKVHVLRVDLVDEDHAVEPALLRGAHHARRVELDPVLGVDDDDCKVHARERRDRLPGEIRHARRIDQVDVDAFVGEVDDGTAEGVAVVFSRGSKSATVDPLSVLPGVPITPVFHSRASVRVVLPAPPWPTRATVWMFSVVYFAMAIDSFLLLRSKK
jgi:hypothetical protein